MIHSTCLVHILTEVFSHTQLLTVLGGQLPGEQTGVSVLQFPQYLPPAANIKVSTSPETSTTMSAAVRAAFRDSLSITGTTFYPLSSPCDDFILLPRSNPHFSLAFDPIAIVFLLGSNSSFPADPSSRSLKASTYPPVRSNDAPISPGRKEFATPGNEFVAMTAAPISPATSTHPQTHRTPPSPWISAFTSSPIVPQAAAAKVGKEGFGTYRLPAGLWVGSEGVLGCELISPPRDSFNRAGRWDASHGSISETPRLGLRGGIMEPDLDSVLSPDVTSMKVWIMSLRPSHLGKQSVVDHLLSTVRISTVIGHMGLSWLGTCLRCCEVLIYFNSQSGLQACHSPGFLRPSYSLPISWSHHLLCLLHSLTLCHTSRYPSGPSSLILHSRIFLCRDCFDLTHLKSSSNRFTLPQRRLSLQSSFEPDK